MMPCNYVLKTLCQHSACFADGNVVFGDHNEPNLWIFSFLLRSPRGRFTHLWWASPPDDFQLQLIKLLNSSQGAQQRKADCSPHVHAWIRAAIRDALQNCPQWLHSPLWSAIGVGNLSQFSLPYSASCKIWHAAVFYVLNWPLTRNCVRLCPRRERTLRPKSPRMTNGSRK